MSDLSLMLPLMAGRDLSNILFHCVWRSVVHDMLATKEESDLVVQHVLRKCVGKAAPMFPKLYSSSTFDAMTDDSIDGTNSQIRI